MPAGLPGFPDVGNGGSSVGIGNLLLASPVTLFQGADFRGVLGNLGEIVTVTRRSERANPFATSGEKEFSKQFRPVAPCPSRWKIQFDACHLGDTLG